MLIDHKNFVDGNVAMGLQILETHTITRKIAVAGLVEEFLRRLKNPGGVSDVIRDAHVCSFVVVEPAWVKVWAQEMFEEASVKVLLRSVVTDVIC